MTTIDETRMHEFHPAPPPHVQSMHGNRGKNAAAPGTKTAVRKRAPRSFTARMSAAEKAGDARNAVANPTLASFKKATFPGTTNADAVDALSMWKGGGYSGIALFLRNREDPPPFLKAKIDAIDAVMRESKLDRDVVVWRGITNGQRTFGDAWNETGDNTGLEFRDLSFTATGADDPEGFYGRAGASMRILVPKGTGAVNMKPFAYGENDNEKELLLDRGLKYRVVRQYVHPKYGRTLDVEVIGK